MYNSTKIVILYQFFYWYNEYKLESFTALYKQQNVYYKLNKMSN